MKSRHCQPAATSAPPKRSFAMPSLRKASVGLGLALALIAITRIVAPAAARASTNQVAIIEDDPHMLTDPTDSLAVVRKLGARIVRVNLTWSSVAPNPRSKTRPSFNATDPGGVPRQRLGAFRRDRHCRQATTGSRLTSSSAAAPRSGLRQPAASPTATTRYFAWKPKSAASTDSSCAPSAALRGSYMPKDRRRRCRASTSGRSSTSRTSGEDLGPQATDGSTIGERRRGCTAKCSTPAGARCGRPGTRPSRHDPVRRACRPRIRPPRLRIAPQGYPGAYGQTKPLIFLRELYCVDACYRPLRGRAASSDRLPDQRGRLAAASAAATRACSEPAAFGDHPYPRLKARAAAEHRRQAPDPNYVSFPDLPNLGTRSTASTRCTAPATRFPIYNDEYGYITQPPHPRPTRTPAGTSPRHRGLLHQLGRVSELEAPADRQLHAVPALGSAAEPGRRRTAFASGSSAFSPTASPKPGYDAYRLPLYLPARRRAPRPARRSGAACGPRGSSRPRTRRRRVVADPVQRERRIKTVRLPIRAPRRVLRRPREVPASGTVALAWTYPKPPTRLLPVDVLGTTVYSRTDPRGESRSGSGDTSSPMPTGAPELIARLEQICGASTC